MFSFWKYLTSGWRSFAYFTHYIIFKIELGLGSGLAVPRSSHKKAIWAYITHFLCQPQGRIRTTNAKIFSEVDGCGQRTHFIRPPQGQTSDEVHPANPGLTLDAVWNCSPGYNCFHLFSMPEESFFVTKIAPRWTFSLNVYGVLI